MRIPKILILKIQEGCLSDIFQLSYSNHFHFLFKKHSHGRTWTDRQTDQPTDERTPSHTLVEIRECI